MSREVRTLEPQSLWSHFADLNEVPRASKSEEQAVEFILDFARRQELEHHRDGVGNVIVRKPATLGREGHPIVAIQSHLDMVHQKNQDTEFDFSTEGIRMRVDGDWVRAEGTTLGADNGIGVAATLAVLTSVDLSHPPIEALFTVDEETGMTGAKGFKGGLLKAECLLNLDTEEDSELTIGCAGGVDVLASGPYVPQELPHGYTIFELKLRSLTGGHSGMDIHLGRANANKLMARALGAAAYEFGVRLAELDGGGLRNAIPREASATVAVPEDKTEAFLEFVVSLGNIFRSEYRTTDPNLEFRAEDLGQVAVTVLKPGFQGRLLRALQALPNGIYRMCPEVPGLVQTSSNLARIVVSGEKFQVGCLCRGSVDSEKFDLAQSIRCAMELADAEVELKGDYPGWKPAPGSRIVRLMAGVYRDLFQEEPHITACHAGLECGILGQNYPDMEMISFGPNIRGAHSPDERVQITSVQKTWKLLVETLARIS